MTPSDGRRRILFICTANICRSPTAELLARRRFTESSMLFRSAGFLESGRSCPPELVDVLAGTGVDASPHRSYQLDATSVAAADLLLTMEGSHVQKATMLAPESFSKILPIKEAADLLGAEPGPQVRVERLIELLNERRDARQYLGTRWDVADPYGGRPRAYRQAVEEIDGLVTAVVGRLA